MRRSTLLLPLALLAGCNSTIEKRQPNWFTPEPNQLFGEGRRDDYHLSFLLRMEYQQQWIQEVDLELDLAAWNDGVARKFVLERQTAPAYTLFTYSKGSVFFPGKDWVVAVKSIVEQDAEEAWERGEAAAREAIARWKARYPEVVEKYNWEEDPKILFRYRDDQTGRFGFYREVEGTMAFDAQGELDPKGFHEAIEARYRWFKEEKPDEVADPNLFDGLRWGLTAFDASPFPHGNHRQVEKAPPEGWQLHTTHVVSSVVKAATTFSPIIRTQLGGWSDRPFDVPCRLAGTDGDERRILCEKTEFGDEGDLGRGFRIVEYRREAVYDVDEERFLYDAVRIVARHEKGDEVRMEITLHDRSRPTP